MAGQHLTGWRLPSLRRAIADQSCPDDPSHRRRQPVASNSTPIERGLITRNYCLPCCALTVMRDSPGRQTGRRYMETLRCPENGVPLSAARTNSNALHLDPDWLPELPDSNRIDDQLPSGLQTGFSVWVYSRSLFLPARQHSGCYIRLVLVLDGLACQGCPAPSTHQVHVGRLARSRPLTGLVLCRAG